MRTTVITITLDEAANPVSFGFLHRLDGETVSIWADPNVGPFDTVEECAGRALARLLDMVGARVPLFE